MCKGYRLCILIVFDNFASHFIFRMLAAFLRCFLNRTDLILNVLCRRFCPECFIVVVESLLVVSYFFLLFLALKEATFDSFAILRKTAIFAKFQSRIIFNY